MKTVLISGTSRGLGNALARTFCKNDFNYFGLTKWNDADIREYESINEYIDYIHKDQFPKVLINNAGICQQDNLLEADIKDIKNMFDVNFFSLVNLTQVWVKKCIEYDFKDCKIINIASTAGTGPRPGRSFYSASKAAVINFSLSMSEELKEYGIKSFCICPAAFDSDMRHKIEPDDDFKNMMKPETVADKIFDIIQLNLDNQLIFIR